MSGVGAVVSGLLLIAGAAFALIATIGVLRFPDVYTRMHAASKAGPVGAGLVLIGLAVHAAEFGVVTRALAGVAFLLLTSPLSAHLLARAAYLSGEKPVEGTDPDALREAREARIGAGTESAGAR